MGSWRGAGHNSTCNTPDIMVGGRSSSLQKCRLLLPLPSAFQMLSPRAGGVRGVPATWPPEPAVFAVKVCRWLRLGSA